MTEGFAGLGSRLWARRCSEHVEALVEGGGAGRLGDTEGTLRGVGDHPAVPRSWFLRARAFVF